jgi:hypothetical protein
MVVQPAAVFCGAHLVECAAGLKPPPSPASRVSYIPARNEASDTSRQLPVTQYFTRTSETQNILLLLVGTFPVLLDALFKHWIFRHLNRHSQQQQRSLQMHWDVQGCVEQAARAHTRCVYLQATNYIQPHQSQQHMA